MPECKLTQVLSVDGHLFIERSGRVDLVLNIESIINRLSLSGVHYARSDRLRAAARARFQSSLEETSRRVLAAHVGQQLRSFAQETSAVVSGNCGGITRVMLSNREPHYSMTDLGLSTILSAYYQRNKPLSEEWLESWLAQHFTETRATSAAA